MDLNGKPITFYYLTSTVHKTIFGGLLTIFSFSLMLIITVTTFYAYFYQKPNINSNIVFHINKQFTYLEYTEIVGKLLSEEIEELDKFTRYFRVAFYEKNEFNSLDNLRVAKLVRGSDLSYKFKFQIPISDVFKDKEFSVLKIMSCKELKGYDFTIWEDENDKLTCDDNYEDYFTDNKNKKIFTFSFNTPIYSIDRKGILHKMNHENEFTFSVGRDKYSSYSMETKFVVIEDNSSLVFSTKIYEAYVVLKNPKLTMKDQVSEGYSLEVELDNISSDEIILITIYKYKLIDLLSKLGGIMKIVTFMKMTCRFWSSYLYERSLYKLIVTRKNKFLEEKKAIIESSFNLKSVDTSSTSLTPNKKKKTNDRTQYTSYCVWFANRFCKCVYYNKEAKQKKKVLTETLGLDNYLLHLDYIDRQIILEHQNPKIANLINDLNSSVNTMTNEESKSVKDNEHVMENLNKEHKNSYVEMNSSVEFK